MARKAKITPEVWREVVEKIAQVLKTESPAPVPGHCDHCRFWKIHNSLSGEWIGDCAKLGEKVRASFGCEKWEKR